MAKRKKRCGQCSKNNLFRPKRTWGECKQSFARRTRDAKTRKQRELERIRKEEDERRIRTKKVFDKKTGTFYEETVPKVAWDHVANGFLGRQQDAARAKERKIKQAQEKAFDDVTRTQGTNFRVTNATTVRLNADKAPFEDRMAQARRSLAEHPHQNIEMHHCISHTAMADGMGCLTLSLRVLVTVLQYFDRTSPSGSSARAGWTCSRRGARAGRSRAAR